jgi:hypothetical protein
MEIPLKKARQWMAGSVVFEFSVLRVSILVPGLHLDRMAQRGNGMTA